MEFKVTLDFAGDKTVINVLGAKEIHDLAAAYTKQASLNLSESADKVKREPVFWEVTLSLHESRKFDLALLTSFTVEAK